MTTPAISSASTNQVPSVGIGCDALVLPPILCDCKGREILLGDTLKVFHFTGARRKKYWMYKHVVERVMLGTANPKPAYKLSHLNLRPESYYWEIIDGRHLVGAEIVQGYGTDGTPFDDRPKHSFQNTEISHDRERRI